MTLSAGEVLQNRYRIASLLGQGGMGAVYRAWHLSLNLPVAVKEMVPQPGLDNQMLAQFRQQFQQEASILARLNHPYLVGVIDFFEEKGNAYLVMQFVEGESLDDRIVREGALPESQVLTWTGQLLDALAYCHDQGVIHRDIKPHNMIIRPDGRATLVDFGLVKLWDPHDPRTKTAMRGMGTPEYAPPEQYDADIGHTDPRSDIYSLGATLYHAVTGQAPPTATQRMVDPFLLKPPRTLNARLSPRTEQAILKALEPQPSHRFQSAPEMAAALTGKAPVPVHLTPSRPQPTKVMPETTPIAMAYARRVPVWTWALGGLVALLLCGVGVVSGMRAFPAMFRTTPTSAPPQTLAATFTPIAVHPSLSHTHTPQVTHTPLPPTATPGPTDTPVQPSSTPRPADTDTPAPTETPPPIPTSTLPPPTVTPTIPSDQPKGRITFTRSAGGRGGTHEIYVLDLDAGNLSRLTNNSESDWIPDWSPDGRTIAFSSARGDTSYDIWVMNSNGGNQTNLIHLPAWDEYADWSPDGQRIAFVSTGVTDGVANSEVFIRESDGSIRQITFNTEADEWPSWSPDGQWLANSSRRDGDMNIFLCAPDGGNITRFTDDPAHDEQPAWSPDGGWVAFIRTERGTGKPGNLWIGRRDNSDFRQLTFDNSVTGPAWSPDGRYIVVAHFWDSSGDDRIGDNDAADLWAIPVGGGQPVVLLEGPERDESPDWTW